MKCNLKLVISIAKKYLNQGLPFEDLIQEGMVGLSRAIDKFDLNKKVNDKLLALSTYATWWIRQSITRAIDNTSRDIRIPIHRLNDLRTIKKEIGKFRETYKIEPTFEELEILIAKAAEKDRNVREMKKEEIQYLVRMLLPSLRLDQANSDDENLTMLDYLSANPDLQPEQKAELSQNQELLTNLLGYLDEEERAMIILKYGLIDGKERNKKELAASTRKFTDAEGQKKIDQILAKLRSIAKRDQANLD